MPSIAEAGRGKREEGRGKREEGRGKRRERGRPLPHFVREGRHGGG
jgi:hypothetical protein